MGTWFDAAQVRAAVHGLEQAIATHGDPSAARRYAGSDGRRVRVVVGVAACALLVALGLWRLSTLGTATEDSAAFHLVSALGLIALAGPVAWSTYAAQRDTSSAADFRRIAERDGMSVVHEATLVREQVGVVPWFATEERATDLQHCVEVRLAGGHRGQRVAYVECCHVVDPLAGDRLLRGSGMLVLGRMKRLARRGMDAVVSLERVDAPDLVVVPRNDPAIGQYQRALAASGAEVPGAALPPAIGKRYWVASTDPRAASALLGGELGRLLGEMDWCIVQVIGGYRVFFGSYRGRSVVSPAPRASGAIEENLEDAAQVFAALAGHTAPRASAAPDRRPTDPPREGRAAAGGAAGTAGSSVLGWLARLAAGGVGAASLLLLVAVLAASIPKYFGSAASLDWPSTTATIVEAALERRDARGRVEVRPRLRYTYEVGGQTYRGRQVQYGMVRVTDEALVEELRVAYPPGAQVPVRYDPRRPSRSVLRPGLFGEPDYGAAACCGASLLLPSLGGFYLAFFGLGWRRRSDGGDRAGRG